MSVAGVEVDRLTQKAQYGNFSDSKGEVRQVSDPLMKRGLSPKDQRDPHNLSESRTVGALYYACATTLTTTPFGSRTKNRRTPHGSSVSGCTIS